MFIMELRMSKVMYEITFPLQIRNDRLSFNYEDFIRRYHVYMKVWSPLVGECLFGKNK